MSQAKTITTMSLVPIHQLDEAGALNWLRQAGRAEVESIAALGRQWGWKRERTSKAIARWECAGHIVREPGAGGNVVIRIPGALPATVPAIVPAVVPAAERPAWRVVKHHHADHPAELPGVTAETITGNRAHGTRDNVALTILAYGLALVGLGINAWFAWNRGTDLMDKLLFASLGLIAEGILFYLPARAAEVWRQRHFGAFAFAVVLWPFLFTFALTNSLGFASLNLTDVAIARAERVTPEVALAQRTADTLKKSREDECRKRGDKCRQLEQDERDALAELKTAQAKVSRTADPQVDAAAKLVAWVSLGRPTPSPEDFGMLRLLLLTLLPQVGGVVLMVARSQRSVATLTAAALARR
jgi:hypothetical protein